MAKKGPLNCPIHYALEAFGDSWSLIVVRDLMFKGKTSYRELLESDEGISTNILADRLLRLEKQGIVQKEVIHTASARTRYSLTDKGLALMPMLVEMILWSATHDVNTAAPKEFVRNAKSNRSALLRQLTKQYEGTPEKV